MLSLLNTTFTNTLRQGFTLIGRLLSKLKARSTYFENQTCTKATLKEIESAELLEKASIITTPTAYSDGVLHSVKPEQTLGSELITNGGFDTSIPLGTAGSGWKFIDSSREGSSGEYYQGGVRLTRTNNLSRFRPLVGNTTSISFFPLESRNYVISYDLISTTDSNRNVSMSAGGQSVQIPGTVGSHTVYFKNGGTSTLCQFSPGNNTDIVLDNISMKEVIDADFTFTRNNPGTRVNASGNIESVGVDLPRIDYKGGCGSLLLEPSRTNLVTYSEDFSQSTWVKQSAGVASAPIITSNYAISPDGTLNADRVVFDINGGTTSSDFSQVADAITNSIGDVTNSVWIKSNTESNYNMSFVNPSANYISIVVTTEWQRFDVTSTTSSTASAFRLRLRGSEATSDYADVSVWGAQVEQGSYPTSYIPTQGVAATRGADLATDAGSSDLISSTEGGLYLGFAALTSINNFESISLSDGGLTERIRFMVSNVENRISIEVDTGNGSGFFRNSTLSDITAFNKIAIKYKQDDYAIWINGVEEITVTTAAVPTLNELTFTAGGISGAKFIGNVKCAAVFKEALTDSELEALTSWVSFSDMANAQLYTIQ